MKCFFCEEEINLTIAFLRGRCNECGKDFYDLTLAVDGMTEELQSLADRLREFYSSVDKAIASEIEAILKKYQKGGDLSGH